MEQQRDLLNNDLLINDVSQVNLVSAAKWGRFLAIVGFIFCGLMVIGGLVMQFTMSSLSMYSYGSEFLKYMGLLYILFAVILLFPCLYLNKFSGKMQEAIKTSNQEALDTAFVNLKSMFKFYGIVTIVMLCFYALAFLFGLGSTMMR